MYKNNFKDTYYRTPKGRSYKKRIQRELNKKLPEILYKINKSIQNETKFYGIFFKKLDNKSFNKLGFHVKIYFDFNNLVFTYTLISLVNNKPLKSLKVEINKK